MKIAYVTPRFYPYIGGVETHVYELAKRMKEFEVEVLTTDPSGKLAKFEEIEGIKVRRFKSYAPSNAYFFSNELRRFLKRHAEDYDLIHAHNFHALPALYAGLSNPRVFILTPHYHGHGHSFFRNVLFRFYKIYGKKVFEKVDAIICDSEFEKRLILRDFKVEEFKVVAIPLGVNKDFLQKSKIGKKILYVGRIEKYKGLEYLIKALKFLPDFELEIVGKGSYKGKIIKLSKKLGVLSRIKFYQDLSREELIKRYAEASVLALPSKFEAYGLVVAEALASKTPCVVAKTSALAEWVDERNVFGIEYPPKPAKLAELIKKASEVEVENVSVPSWDEVAEKTKEVYFATLEKDFKR
ncbi:MAG: glycosyltransferase family 4 protein [Archaeoglobales archaeon]|nr:glycosyltransferase family 4 protein [Archaeoglobales archaeon]